jgi:hypothetical protein
MNQEKHLVLILMIGCLFSTIVIIISVDYLFQEKQYFQLAITGVVFAILVLSVRQLKMQYERLDKLEKELAN